MTEVDAFLDDLDRLAAVAPTGDPAAFYRQMLPAAAMAIGADAASFEPATPISNHSRSAMWSAEGGPGATLLDPSAKRRVLTTGGPRVEVAPDDGAAVVACPVDGAGEPAGVLALRLTPSAGATPERSLELVAAVAEIASRYELRRAADEVADARGRVATLESVLLRLHAARGLRDLANEAADSGRELVGCDRLAVIACSGATPRVTAVSGVARVRRRSDAARRMARLAAACLREGTAVRYPNNDNVDSSPLTQAVDGYADAAGVRALAFVPCRSVEQTDESSERPAVALLAEWFGDDRDPEQERLLAPLSRHLAVAARREAGPIRRRLTLGRLAIAGLALIVITAVTATLAFVPATLWVAVEGRFEQAERARVFAPLDGVVDELLVTEGDRVDAGQPLVRLAAPELRLRQEETAEAIASTRAEIVALETAKLRATLPGREDDADPTAIAGRLAALRDALKHQQARRSLLDEQAERLTVTSPIAGVVVSWRPEEALDRRPVTRGQRLLDVAADDAWRLELDVPDHRSGHLLRADASSAPLAVEYVVRADPSTTHTARIDAIADATHADAQGQPVVRVVATPDDAGVANPRGGLGVSAKIDCGVHPLGYVWLHEAIEAIRRRWF